nr:MAG TPA: hypothetical protein [Caudoviricetes sp.]
MYSFLGRFTLMLCHLLLFRKKIMRQSIKLQRINAYLPCYKIKKR